jgi:UDP-N-acetyl-D-glucosamine dehydrogenase
MTKKDLGEFDCVVIAVDHSGLDYDFILRNSRLIFDARNIYKDKRNKKIVRL